MTKTVSTKRALILSLLSMLLCVSMLIGSTYAWFTDTANTAVNKIQAGTLAVALEMKDNAGNADPLGTRLYIQPAGIARGQQRQSGSEVQGCYHRHQREREAQ